MPSKSGTTSSRSRRAEPARDSAGALFTETGDMNLGLEGRAVLLAGASRGIGLATATAFAAEGSRAPGSVLFPGGSWDRRRRADVARDRCLSERGRRAEPLAHLIGRRFS